MTSNIIVGGGGVDTTDGDHTPPSPHSPPPYAPIDGMSGVVDDDTTEFDANETKLRMSVAALAAAVAVGDTNNNHTTATTLPLPLPPPQSLPAQRPEATHTSAAASSTAAALVSSPPPAYTSVLAGADSTTIAAIATFTDSNAHHIVTHPVTPPHVTSSNDSSDQQSAERERAERTNAETDKRADEYIGKPSIGFLGSICLTVNNVSAHTHTHRINAHQHTPRNRLMCVVCCVLCDVCRHTARTDNGSRNVSVSTHLC